MARPVSKIYGEALFMQGTETGKLQELYYQADFIKKTLDQEPELMDFLCHPRISAKDKFDSLLHIFGERISTDMEGFLHVVITKKREKELPSILGEFLEMTKDYLLVGTAYVTTPDELSLEQRNKVEERLQKTTPYDRLEMHFSVDESLLGGMVIRVGDRVVDSSVKTKLQNIKKELRSIKLSTEE